MRKTYIEREGFLERVWQVWYTKNGFKYCVFVQGTEPEVYDYMVSEFGSFGRHWAVPDKDLETVKSLGFPIYLAPKRED